jgi:Outer membrane receptor for ferric coprogen and ferric-rhodotorulic acid
MPIRRATGRRLILTLLALALFIGSGLFGGTPSRIQFDVPAGDALRTLRLFSQQSGLQILYSPDHVRGIKTRAVQGSLSPLEALEFMLAQTALVIVHDRTVDAVAIRRTSRVASPRYAGSESARPTPAPRIREREREPGIDFDQPILLTPFEVRSDADVGYKAANSASATRMAVPISQLPMSVTAFTEAFIADQKAYDLYDIVKWAPGVHQDNVSPQGWARYNVRGFSSAAAIQRNGFGSFRFIDTTNIARVEVVKGPASLLYGQLNPGGVINYITKRPEATPSLRVDISTGDRGFARGVVDATGPVSSSKPQLLYRAIAMGERIQQFQQLGRGRKYLFAPSATWKLSENTTLTVEYEHFERREEMITGGVVLRYADGIPRDPYPGLPWDFSYAGEGDYQNFVSNAFSTELTTKLSEQITLRAAYLDARWDMEWRATGQGGTGLIDQSFIDAYYPASAGLTSDDAMYRRNRWEHQWGGERTAQFDAVTKLEFAGLKVDLLLGYKHNFDTGFHGQQRNNPNLAGHPAYLPPWDLRDPATWDRRVPFGLTALVPAVDTHSSSANSALAGIMSVSAFDDRLKLLAGYAHHRVENDPTYNRLAGTATSGSIRSAGVPQAGVLATVAPGVSVFASYSESFLANTNMLRVNNVFTTPAAPSVGRGLDAGFKLDLLDGKLSGTVSVYRIRARPTGIIIVTTGVDSSGTTLFTDIQGGSQLSEGFEFDLILSPSDRFQLIAGFNRGDAVYERHPTNPALNGTPLVAAPEKTFNLWGKYLFGPGPLHGFLVAGGFNYVGSMSYVGNNPAARFPAYVTADATVGWRFRAFSRPWEVQCTVKNLANERYYTSATSWGFPRHTIVSLSTRF